MAIHYERAGRGPSVLLIQGVGVAGCGWQPQVEGLQDMFELAWFDNPGIGRSEGPPGDMARMVEAAIEVLDALDWPSAHVCGHSLGGVVAQRLAHDHPQRVRSLALLNTFAVGKATLSFSVAALWTQTRMFIGTRASRRRAFFEFVSTLPPTEENIAALEAAFGRSLADLPSAARAQLRTLVGADHRDWLSSLEQPAMVIGAEHDRPAPLAQSRMLAELLECPLHVFDTGHALPVERAEDVNGLLRAFWEDARSP